jgi:hypothetical protein
MADVSADLLRGGSKTRDCIGNDKVDLARISLCRDIIAARKASFLAEQVVELVALGTITAEDLEE